MNKKGYPIHYQTLNSCWNENLNWTFELVEILKNVYGDNGRITDLEESKMVLLSSKNKLAQKKEQVISTLKKINIHVKPVRNFINSSENLLKSTEINLSKFSKMRIEPFDLFETIQNKELTIWELNRNIEIVKRNVENNWVACNQNYGRMLIKLKINDY